MNRSPSNMWDYIAKKTATERSVCKTVVYGLLYGHIAQVCIDSVVNLETVINIRCAFDDFVEERE